MSNNIDLYIQEIEGSKQQIKNAIIAKGVTPTGGLTSYAGAISQIVSDPDLEVLEVTIEENGLYQYNSDADGYSDVKVTVDVPIPTFETQSKEVTIKNNGTTSIVPDSGYDGLSKVDVTVNVATGGSDKPQIPNGFRFTGGDIAQVDFSQYDWSLVYDTSNFFQGCTHSTGDWSNFEENFNGEVLSGYGMFQNFSGTSIPNIDHPICLAQEMFRESKITTIPQLDTSNVMDMTRMFYSCSKLTTIPQLDTSKVTSMYQMFQNCFALTTIPPLDTSKVTDMSNMFSSCSKLTTIPQLDTSSAIYMSNMFSSCPKLTTIPQLDTSKVTSMNGMFQNCSALTTIPQLDTSKVTSMSNMFDNCSQLTYIPQFDTSNVTNMSYMFQNCSALTTIPQLDTSSVTNINRMFYGCGSLTTLPDFNSVKVANFGASSTGAGSWLYDCWRIEKIGVVDCDSVTDVRYFFSNTTRTYLTEFGGCRNLGKASSVSYTDGYYFMSFAPNLNYESVMNVINGLYDRASAGLSVLTLRLHANHLAMLSEDDIAIATNKGWTIV